MPDTYDDLDPFYFWDKPLEFIGCVWPHIKIYSKQREILRSLVVNDETFVPAGNMLGGCPPPA